MADDKASIVVDGDVSPLRQKLRDASRDFKQFGDEGKRSIEGVGGPLKALQEKFIAIGAVLAGGAVFKAAVTEAASFAEQSIQLGRALGISATEASGLKAALDDNNVTQEEFVRAAQQLSAKLKENEKDMQAAGLATRDAAGNLRPLNQLTIEAIGLLDDYKGGTDRAVAANILFGRGFELTSDLARLNNEEVRKSTEFARKLGLQVGEENVAAWEAYDNAMDGASTTMKAARVTIGNQLLPALTKLAEWFVSLGPAAITVFKGALGGLMAAFWALKNGITVVWETINAMVVTVAEPLRTLAAALWKMAQGDFKGAWAEFGKGGQTMANAWKGALKEMEASSRETRDKIWSLFAQGGAAAGVASGDKSATGLIKGDKDKKAGAGKGRMSEAEWAMEESAHLKRTLNQIAEQRAQAEEAMYERGVQAAKDWEEDLERSNQAVAAAHRKSAEQRAQIELLRAQGARDAELARLDEMEALSRHELEMGAITQAEYLTRLGEFNQARLDAERAFLDQKRDIARQDPDQNPVELERIEQEKLEILRRYRAQQAEIQRQAALESQTIWTELGDRISGLWDKGIQALMNGTLTWRNAMRAIWAEMVSWFVTQVVGRMVKEWLLGEARKLAIKMGFLAQEKTVEAAGAAATVAIKTGETAAVSANNAVQAGTGAAASQASIPIIGPILALAAMAAIFAAVSGLGKRKSAMGGYDIPKGLNPVVQTHEEEMILPRKYADVIRGLAAGDGSGQAAGGAPVHLHARSDADVVRVGDVKKLLREMGRDFVDFRSP